MVSFLQAPPHSLKPSISVFGLFHQSPEFLEHREWTYTVGCLSQKPTAGASSSQGRLEITLTLGTHQESYSPWTMASGAMGDHRDVAGRDHVLEP